MTDFINNNSRIALDLMEEQTGAPYALLKQLAHEDYFKILKRRYEGRKDFQSLQAHRKDFQAHVESLQVEDFERMVEVHRMICG